MVAGNTIAADGRWAAVFLANVHFEAVGTNYFTVTLPPSPLQNYWSLSVEEQFYVVYPTLFLLVAWARLRISLEAKLAVVLGAVIVVSYWLSVVQTQSHPTMAYFSLGNASVGDFPRCADRGRVLVDAAVSCSSCHVGYVGRVGCHRDVGLCLHRRHRVPGFAGGHPRPGRRSGDRRRGSGITAGAPRRCSAWVRSSGWVAAPTACTCGTGRS